MAPDGSGAERDAAEVGGDALERAEGGESGRAGPEGVVAGGEGEKREKERAFHGG